MIAMTISGVIVLVIIFGFWHDAAKHYGKDKDKDEDIINYAIMCGMLATLYLIINTVYIAIWSSVGFDKWKHLMKRVPSGSVVFVEENGNDKTLKFTYMGEEYVFDISGKE